MSLKSTKFKFEIYQDEQLEKKNNKVSILCPKKRQKKDLPMKATGFCRVKIKMSETVSTKIIFACLGSIF